MNHWAKDAIFYHIYPLGFCDAPTCNDFSSPACPRLDKILTWADHILSLNANALYLGPLFESTSHGYDTVDYFNVDRRLGDNRTLAYLVSQFHQRGVRVILDGVFNHTGRDFWAFRDVKEKGASSPFCTWFSGLRFDQSTPYHDPFTYDTWNGHYNLVKLNLSNPAVKAHLFKAVETWITQFDIDGLRLDAADCIDGQFLAELAQFCRRIKPDFWLMGEVVHGDYRRWANPAALDSVTNYECYKGLYSSHNDVNYFEIAYSLNRQFGEEGLYRGLDLYAFADNHDVNRLASMLKKPGHLYPLYVLLFSMPGIPSVYYGSEFGIEGKKNGTDAPLRPSLELAAMVSGSPHPDLLPAIRRLAGLRRQLAPLRHGDYHQLHVSHEQFAFSRQAADTSVLVAVNAADSPVKLALNLPSIQQPYLWDVLNQEKVAVNAGKIELVLNPCWARILTGFSASD